MKQKIKNLNLIIVLIIGFFLSSGLVLAATLYLEPAEGGYDQGDTFIAEIKLDTEGEYINTMQVNLVFSQDILEVQDFSKGNSVLTVWVQEPSFSNEAGTLSLIGGVPGGYQGFGDSLGKIIFKTKKQGLASVKIQEDSRLLLNDGFGTPAELKIKEGIFAIGPKISETPADSWQEEIKKDVVPPEPFKLNVTQDPLIFDGKHFITFSTTDKQTGINYYEVKEDERDWKRGVSPYLLEDQSLRSIITVRAVDKAGNERIAEIAPMYSVKDKNIILRFTIIFIVSAAIISIIIRKKIFKKR